MKHLYNMAWGLLLVAGLASCEMKNELFDEKGSGATGVLEIGVAVNKTIDNVATRAGEDDAEEGVGVPVESDEVAADGFEIDITGEDNFSEQLTYNSGETNSISLPEGTYTVYAHTPGEMGRVMDVPYYGGSTDKGTIVITSGTTSTATVKCVMENTRIKLGYDDQFLATYASWNITIENGSDDQVLSAVYEGTGEPPVIDKYWDLGDGVASVIVKGYAVLKEGGATVPVSKVLTKVNGEDFVGAEALNITLVLGSGGVSGSLAGVDVVVNLFGTEPDSGDTVEVPIETEDDDDPITPKPPVGDAPTIVFPQTTYTLPLSDGTDPSKIEAVITAPKGLKSIVVKIKGGNALFTGIIGSEDIFDGKFVSEEGLDLIERDDISSFLTGFFQESGSSITVLTPREGDTEYHFPVGGFFEVLSGLGATTEAAGHTFSITVIDKEGTSTNNDLYVIVNE